MYEILVVYVLNESRVDVPLGSRSAGVIYYAGLGVGILVHDLMNVPLHCSVSSSK
jgi:hypothetical protein